MGLSQRRKRKSPTTWTKRSTQSSSAYISRLRAEGDEDSDDEEEESDGMSDLEMEENYEDVRLSTSLFNSFRIADFITLYFSMTAVGCSVIAYEFDEREFRAGVLDSLIDGKITLLMWVAVVFNVLAICSIVMRENLYFQWLLAKRLVTKYDNMRNTGEATFMYIEIFFMLLMPFPLLRDTTYFELYNDKRYDFKLNSLLLCVMTFARLHQIVKCFLLYSYWTSPRS